jgi:hypothetical protein
VPAENGAPELKLPVTFGVEQLSVAVGAVQTAPTVVTVVLGIARLMLLGQAVNTGATRSFAQSLKGWTVMLNVQVAVLLAASLAVYVTEVVPTEKLAPELTLFAIVGVEQLSVAVGAVQVAVVVVAVAFGRVRVILVGQFAKMGATRSVAQALNG